MVRDLMKFESWVEDLMEATSSRVIKLTVNYYQDNIKTHTSTLLFKLFIHLH